MQGDKLTHAIGAIVEVIESLDHRDVLHLVCYGSAVVTVFENAGLANRQALIQQVKAIKTEGCTNLWGGVERGAELLLKHRQPEFTSRLFLFSDGLVNEGIQDKELIQKKVAEELYDRDCIQVSAFGLGKDFDEELMKGIADSGNGAYFFIEGANSIPAFVEFALKSILKMVGMDAVVQIRGINSGLVVKFYGHHDVIKGARLGDLRSDNVRSLLMHMEVRGDVGADVVEQEVLRCELSYQKPASNGTGELESEKVPVVVKVKFTNDAAEVENGRSAEVRVKMVVQETAEIDKQLVKLMDNQDDDDDDDNDDDDGEDEEEDGEEEKSEEEEESKRKRSPKNKEAISLQQKQIRLFEEVLDIDNQLLGGQNKIASLLALAREGLKKLKKEGVTKKARKEVHHRAYAKSRG